jgi:hypothetical protein
MIVKRIINPQTIIMITLNLPSKMKACEASAFCAHTLLILFIFFLIKPGVITAQPQLFQQGTAHVDSTVAYCGFDPTELYAKSMLYGNDTVPIPQSGSKLSIQCGAFSATFVDCIGNTGEGFDHLFYGPGRRDVVCQVLTYISEVIDFSALNSPINIRFDGSTTLPFNVLGTGGPLLNSSLNNTFYSGHVHQFYTNPNSNPTSGYHGFVNINFNGLLEVYPNYYPIFFDMGCNSFDLYSVVLHEMIHVLGFFSFIIPNSQQHNLPLRSGYGTNSNVFTHFDKHFLNYDNNGFNNIATANYTKLIGNNNGIPVPATNLPQNCLVNGNIWLYGNIPINQGNEPIYSGRHFHPPPGDNLFTNGSFLSHIDGINYGYYDRGHAAKGFMPNYVMYQNVSQSEYRREFTKEELNILQTIGYNLSPNFLSSNSLNPPGSIPNSLILNNRSPRTTKAVIPNLDHPEYLFYPDFGLVTGLSAPNIADVSISTSQTHTFVLNNDPQLIDADGDHLSIYPGSLFNIRGCGISSNDQACLSVNPAGNQIIYTPRPDFFGRAQFGFNLYDGKQKGAFVVYTIDVTKGNNFIAPANMVLNPQYELGTEIKTTLHPNVENSLLKNGKWGQYYWGGSFSDAHYFTQFVSGIYAAENGLWIRNITGNIIRCSGFWCNSMFGCGYSSQQGWGNPSLCVPNNYHPIIQGNTQRFTIGNSNWCRSYPTHYSLTKTAQKCRRYRITFDAALGTWNPAPKTVAFSIGFDNDIDAHKYDNYVAHTGIFICHEQFNTYSFEFNYCNAIDRDFLIVEAGFDPYPFDEIINGTIYNLIAYSGRVFLDNLILEDITDQTPHLSVTIPQNTFGYCASAPQNIQFNPLVEHAKCATTYSWQPAAGLSNPNILNPIASPSQTTVYTLTVYDGCTTATATVTVNVFPDLPVNAGNDAAICEGDMITLGGIAPDPPTALGGVLPYTYSWTPIGGLSCFFGTNCSNPVAYPSITTNYTVTVTDALGCTGSDMVTVEVFPAVSVQAQAASTNICSGGCTSLSALVSLPGGTITWTPCSTGMHLPPCTGQSIQVCPEVTNTYTVSYELNGCIATDAVTVTVNPLPDAPVISGFNNNCQGNLATYSIGNPVAGYEYHWQLSGGVFSGSNSGTQVNVLWNNLQAQGQGAIYVFTINPVTGCQSPVASLVVFVCCPGENPKRWFNDFTITQGHPKVYNNIHDIAVNGILTIAADVTFRNCNISMGQNAKIVVEEGYTLTFDDCGLYAGCKYMWDGIYVTHPTSWIIIKNSTGIQGAQQAIVSINNGGFDISKSNFESNYINIKVLDHFTAPQLYQPILPHQGSVVETRFSGNTLPYEPYKNIRTYAGIFCNKVFDLTIGNNLEKNNTFENMQFGIKAMNSSLKVYNNKFEKIYKLPNLLSWLTGQYTGMPDEGAIHAVFNLSSLLFTIPPYLEVEGLNNKIKNEIKNCNQGIYTDNYWVKISDNKVEKTLGTAVYCRNIRTYPAKQAVIERNDIKLAANGIRVQNVTVSNVGHNLTVNNNKLENATRGIWLTNINSHPSSFQFQTKVEGNRITYKGSGGEKFQYGITLENCRKIRAYSNIIKNEHNTVWANTYGILAANSEDAEICRNLAQKFESGIYCKGNLINTRFWCNTLDRCTRGFYFHAPIPPTISDQGEATIPSDNRWLNCTKRLEGNINLVNNVMVNWSFRGDNILSNQYATYVTDPPLSVLIDQKDNTNFSSPCGQFSSSSPTNPAMREKKFGKIVRDELSFSQNDSTLRYQNKNYLYSELRSDPALIYLGTTDDPLYADFFAQHSLSNMEPLHQVIDEIDTNNYSHAGVINSIISPVNEIENLNVKVNAAYLGFLERVEQVYTPDEIDELLILRKTPVERPCIQRV